MKIKFINLPSELSAPLCEVENALGFEICDDGKEVKVIRNEVGPKLIVEGKKITLEYHKKPEFFRMLTMLPSRINQQGTYEEFPAHEDLCLMSDCSRNAVFNLSGAKRMIRYLALMGFTSFMLYTEDTYEIPEYPEFGYMRGRFSQEELREIDDYAYSFGIEMIPCMQTLAHLPAALRWGRIKEMNDVDDILLVGDEKTYDFIEAMIRSWRSVYRTKRIHIGMDEALLLGSGKYLDIHGYRERSQIILEHLDRVVKICEKYDFAPMIWSDMFFRIAFHTYYVSEGEISKDVIDMVPKNVTLAYWDYYTEDEKRFRHMMHCHKQFKNPMVFAGGAWKWSGMTPLNHFSLNVNKLHLRVAKEERVPMVIATAWGDNGAEASNFSIMATLQQYAEYCYACGEDDKWLADRFEETFHLPFETFLLLDEPSILCDTKPNSRAGMMSKYLLYNDPLGGWIDISVKKEYAENYRNITKKLEAVPENQFSTMFKAAEALSRLLEQKATLSLDIRESYNKGDKESLAELAKCRIPLTIELLDQYIVAARKEWTSDNKYFGFDVIELRLGGLKERLSTAKRTIEEYLDGTIETIEFLDGPLERVSTAALNKPYSITNRWSFLASCSII